MGQVEVQVNDFKSVVNCLRCIEQPISKVFPPDGKVSIGRPKNRKAFNRIVSELKKSPQSKEQSRRASVCTTAELEEESGFMTPLAPRNNETNERVPLSPLNQRTIDDG